MIGFVPSDSLNPASTVHKTNNSNLDRGLGQDLLGQTGDEVCPAVVLVVVPDLVHVAIRPSQVQLPAGRVQHGQAEGHRALDLLDL